MATKKLAYTLTKQGSKVCTANRNTGKTIACYANRAGAITALKALYAKAGDKVGGDKKKTSMASLDDVAFDEAMGCVEDGCDRSFLTLSSFVGHVETMHPEAGDEKAARWVRVPCSHDDCSRSFLTEQAMLEHAESVHTFDDIQRLVAEAVREAYAAPNTNGNGTTWCWVEALAADYVVFSIEKPNDMNLYKAPYVLSGTSVTLGDPVQVIRRTVYDPVENPDPAPVKNQAAISNGQ